MHLGLCSSAGSERITPNTPPSGAGHISMNDRSLNDLSLNDLSSDELSSDKVCLDDHSLDDQSFDDLRAHERNLEEEWISKYRTALHSVPMREHWDAHLYRIAYRAGGTFASCVQEIKAKIASSQIVTRWMDLVWSSSPASKRSELRLAVPRTMPAYSPQKHRPVALHGSGVKKAG